MKPDHEELTRRLIEFRDARDWRQFHSLKNLIMSTALEAAEIMELTQWKGDEAVERAAQGDTGFRAGPQIPGRQGEGERKEIYRVVKKKRDGPDGPPRPVGVGRLVISRRHPHSRHDSDRACRMGRGRRRHSCP